MADLSKALADKLTRAFNMIDATRTLGLDIFKVFVRDWYTVLRHKVTSYGISAQVFNFVFSFLSNRLLHVVLNGKSLHESPASAGILENSIFGPCSTLMILHCKHYLASYLHEELDINST